MDSLRILLEISLLLGFVWLLVARIRIFLRPPPCKPGLSAAIQILKRELEKETKR